MGKQMENSNEAWGSQPYRKSRVEDCLAGMKEWTSKLKLPLNVEFHVFRLGNAKEPAKFRLGFGAQPVEIRS